MQDDIKVELYFSVDNKRNITISKLLETGIQEKYKSIFFGVFIVRYGKQKIEIYEPLALYIQGIMTYIPYIVKNNIFCTCSYSEFNNNCYSCIYSSLSEKVVKLAYIDSSLEGEGREKLSGTNSMIEWFPKFMNNRNHIIYTKKKVLSDNNLKNSFSGYFESEIVIPFEVFFGSFFDQVEHYWRILKETGFIRDSWEVLEKAKEIVEDIRFRLDKNMPLF